MTCLRNRPSRRRPHARARPLGSIGADPIGDRISGNPADHEAERKGPDPRQEGDAQEDADHVAREGADPLLQLVPHRRRQIARDREENRDPDDEEEQEGVPEEGFLPAVEYGGPVDQEFVAANVAGDGRGVDDPGALGDVFSAPGTEVFDDGPDVDGHATTSQVSAQRVQILLATMLPITPPATRLTTTEMTAAPTARMAKMIP